VRQSYFGGATDFYLALAKGLKYFDVNSLYPFSMLKEMPLNGVKVKQVHDLESFYGFVKVEVYCPKSVERPLLPVKHGGKTIFPTGKWTGVYFSEELKAVKKYIPSYQFELLNGYSFDKALIFNDYVETLYEIKRVTTGAKRWIAKLLLNCLYGSFGRKLDTTSVLNVNRAELELCLLKYKVAHQIKISEDIHTIVIKNEGFKNKAPLSELNSTIITSRGVVSNSPIIGSGGGSGFVPVKSNVAIASAITAYARIFMMPFKLDPLTDYSDTDSIFTRNLLGLLCGGGAEKLIGKELGMFKDELDGGVIEEAIFLGIKQYGYWFYNKAGLKVERSVFSGVERDALKYRS